MKNIAIIITKLSGGGAERCASNLSVELSKRYNVTLIVFDGTNMTYPYGGELVDLGIGSSQGGLKRILNVFRRVAMIRRIKKEKKIDCAISLLDGPNMVNVLSKQGEKTIVSVRNMLSCEPMSALRKWLVRQTSLRADLTVSLSEMVRLDLEDTFRIPGEKIKTIYNHCDAGLLRQLAEETPLNLDIDPEKVNFVTMGRLNHQKGQWHLLRAFKKVVAQIPNAHLYILGVGELEEPLKKLVSQLGLENAVTMPGYIKNPHGIYSHCQAFVFPSLFEGLGNVLLEALAFDMPIISADCQAGPREILAPETDIRTQAKDVELAQYGVLVPVCDGQHFNAADPLTPEETCLAEAMVLLHNDPVLRQSYRQKAAERMQNFEKNAIMQQWSAVIEN